MTLGKRADMMPIVTWLEHCHRNAPPRELARTLGKESER